MTTWNLDKYKKFKKITIAVDVLKEVYGTLQMFLFIHEEAVQTIGMGLWLSFQAQDKEAVNELADYGLNEIIWPSLGWIAAYGHLCFPNDIAYTEFFLAAEKSFLRYKELVSFQLAPKQGIHIFTSPSYAKITIDGADTEQLTPEKFELPVGNHTLRLELEGYKILERAFYVPRGEIIEVSYKLESAKQGIHIVSVPYNAQIFIDEEDTEQLTPETFDLTPGPHDIKLVKVGYDDYETAETIPDGEYIEVIYYLVETE